MLLESRFLDAGSTLRSFSNSSKLKHFIHKGCHNLWSYIRPKIKSKRLIFPQPDPASQVNTLQICRRPIVAINPVVYSLNCIEVPSCLQSDDYVSPLRNTFPNSIRIFESRLYTINQSSSFAQVQTCLSPNQLRTATLPAPGLQAKPILLKIRSFFNTHRTRTEEYAGLKDILRFVIFFVILFIESVSFSFSLVLYLFLIDDADTKYEEPHQYIPNTQTALTSYTPHNGHKVWVLREHEAPGSHLRSLTSE